MNTTTNIVTIPIVLGMDHLLRWKITQEKSFEIVKMRKEAKRFHT